MAVAMRGKEAAAMLPEPGPDLVEVSLGDLQSGERRAREKLETSFAVGRRESGELPSHFEEEEQPMAAAFIAMLADNTGQVQVWGGNG